MAQQRGTQLAVREELDAAVDGEGEVAAGLRGAQQVDVADDVAAAVADHALGAGAAAQPFVEGELQAFLALVVDVGEAEHVRERVALRIEAPVLALARHAGQAEREDPARLVGIDAALEIDEFLARALRELAREHVDGYAQGLGERGQPVGRLQHFLRVGPDRFDRRGHRQRLAVAVGDHAARGRDRNFP